MLVTDYQQSGQYLRAIVAKLLNRPLAITRFLNLNITGGQTKKKNRREKERKRQRERMHMAKRVRCEAMPDIFHIGRNTFCKSINLCARHRQRVLYSFNTET